MTSKIYAGIDCGYRTGGVALIDKSGFAEVHDLPVYSEGGVDITALNEILTSVDIDHIFIEKQQAMPKQGVSSTFKLGYAYGQIVTTVALTQTPYTILTRPLAGRRDYACRAIRTRPADWRSNGIRNAPATSHARKTSTAPRRC